jgi:hypothetical protein
MMKVFASSLETGPIWKKQASRHNRSISYSSVTDQPPNVCIPWFAASYAAFDVATFAEFAAIPTPSPSRS